MLQHDAGAIRIGTQPRGMSPHTTDDPVSAPRRRSGVPKDRAQSLFGARLRCVGRDRRGCLISTERLTVREQRPLQLRTHPAHAWWNETGYDLIRQDRFVYAFLTGSGAEVKVGMVGVEGRLGPRLREVAKKWGDPDLRMVGSCVVPDVDSQTVESVEAVIRHWLVLAAGFRHAGRVDGLAVPTPPPDDWSALLEEAVEFALNATRWSRRNPSR